MILKYIASIKYAHFFFVTYGALGTILLKHNATFLHTFYVITQPMTTRKRNLELIVMI